MRPVRLTRAQQQAVTRERLLAAAEQVFARYGYGGASIELITSEAGYSKGAIYSNFESKEAVVSINRMSRWSIFACRISAASK